jgi:3-hydroxyacyl-CoA dehydrogenase
MPQFASIGAGLIGRAWAIVFARSGYPVKLYDLDPAAVDRALGLIDQALADLAGCGLIEQPAAEIRARIQAVASLGEALAGADYVQESASERLDLKQQLYLEMDRLARPEAIFASSTSFIPTSQFSRDVPGRHRCLVAHPVNPPHLIPVVEISPASWTAADVVERTRQIQIQVGQTPVVVRKEIRGFLLNRLQSVLMAEAFRLVDDGYCSIEDLDVCLKDGLGLRWSFMGPYETIDLNAPGGVIDYAARFVNTMLEIDASAESAPRAPSADFFARVNGERRRVLPLAEKDQREAWRDRRLMELLAHKRAMAHKLG